MARSPPDLTRRRVVNRLKSTSFDTWYRTDDVKSNRLEIAPGCRHCPGRDSGFASTWICHADWCPATEFYDRRYARAGDGGYGDAICPCGRNHFCGDARWDRPVDPGGGILE